MSNVGMLLAAALVVLPAAALTTSAAQAENWQGSSHGRAAVGVGHTSGHRVNSYQGYQINRGHGQDRRNGIRRNHRPLFGFVGRGRHRNGH